MKFPDRLNGYPTVAFVPRTQMGDGIYYVIVDRGHDYVVATWWSDPNHDGWSWGHYGFKTRDEAMDFLYFREKGAA